MNENLQDVLVKTLEKALKAGGEVYDATKDGLSKAIDFASEQIPDIITQLLKWEFVYHLIWAAAYSLITLAILIAAAKLFKATKSSNWEDETIFFTRLATVIMVLIASCFIFFGTVSHVAVCAKVYYAPKVFLIEYCSDLLSVRQYNASHPDYYPKEPRHNH